MDKLDTENLPRFNLSALYAGADDPQIDVDIAHMEELYKKLSSFEGHLDETLPLALETLIMATRYAIQLEGYFYFLKSQQMQDDVISARYSTIEQKCIMLQAEYATYFELEVVDMDATVLEQWYASEPLIAKHRPFLENIRKNKPHQLSKEVEKVIANRGVFASPEWSNLLSKYCAQVKICINGEDKNLEQALDILLTEKNQQVRFNAQKAINNALKDQLAFPAQMAFNNVIGMKNQDDKERGYAHIMASENLANMLDDTVVDSLLSSTLAYSQRISKRYYGLKAALMGEQLPLYWSDRLAPISFASEKVIPWEEAVGIVSPIFENFHPLFGQYNNYMMENGHVDVPSIQGKRSGAYNHSFTTIGGDAVSFSFFNYMGSMQDVMTLAHEQGHAVHGYLAYGEQDILMGGTPICYCETASIFSEMLTFDALYAQEEDDHEKLNMLMNKLDDFFGSVMRQISFCAFEQLIHEARKKGALSIADYCHYWREAVKQFYGEDGDVFVYEHSEYLWSYLTHLCRPFYVYSYAFGELFTQSLFAVKDNYEPEVFANLFVEMLKKGGTENAVLLMKPFGLDPRDPAFWDKAFEVSVVVHLDEAEALAKKLGYY